MQEFLLYILIFVLLVRWLIIRSRLRDLEHRVKELNLSQNSSENQNELIAGLIRRVRALEMAREQPHAPAMTTAAAPEVPVPVAVIAVPPPLPLPVAVVAAPPSLPVEIRMPLPVAAEVSSPVPPPIPVPVLVPIAVQPDLRERVRARMGGEEWEALVGGSWLNKLGVLLVVISVALLLSYGFTQTGPLGRVGIGLLVSLAMLGTGVALERRKGYRVFGRGLIGGGWAALYFTTYATYAIPAAKVIENPYAASALLLAVAAGMILHSLHYRSQTVTGLAYFIAFATLMLSDVTPFAVMALIPLAGSLLFTAYRFSWFVMAFFGLFATWGTLISRGDSGAPLATTESVFVAYWLLFEIFDLMRTARRDADTRLTQFILPINAGAFLLLSWHKWDAAAPADVWKFWAEAAAAYFIGALLRVKIRPPSSFAEETRTLQRMMAGGYEGAITIAAVLAGLAIFGKAPTVWINAGLLIEGELLFLAGLRFGEKYLRWLAAAAFGVSLGKLGMVDVPANGAVTIAGLHMKAWTPVAFAHGATFYLNRVLRKTAREYSWAAAAVVTAVLCAETPREYLAVALMVYAVVLFELGLRARLLEFRYQAYVAGMSGVMIAAIWNVVTPDPAWKWPWLPLAICTVISYLGAVRIRGSQEDRVEAWEPTSLRQAGSAAATFLAMSLMWKLAPGDYLALAWIALGALLFEIGHRGFPSEMRWTSYAASAIGAGRLLVLDVFGVTKAASRAEQISLICAAVIGYAITARVFSSKPDRIAESERAWVRDVNSFAATTFLLTAGWVMLPDAVVAVGWAAVGLVLLEIGFASATPSFRLQGHLIGKLVFFRLFFANFTDLGHTGWFSHRLLTVIPIIVSEYYIWWRYKTANVSERERNACRLYQYAAAIAAVVLSRFELGRALTVTGWATVTLALYIAGIRLKDVHFRWQSYAVAALAFWRCWDTNFYIPESLAGLPGRVLTGAFVVACLYAAQLLSPRSGEASENAPKNFFAAVDRHSRLWFSGLASMLLAVMLYYEVSGGMLTVAWTAQAMMMLVSGFPLRDRPLRLIGLLLFLACILKVFLWDLRHLETLQRIVSFMVLGLILVGVSWMYTRFRNQIQQYL